MILLIDNYDSFSYNLYQLIGSFDPDIKVIRNDALTVNEIDVLSPDAIMISPGPGRPEDAGICIECIQKRGSKYPMLGVCLGHQSICEAYGATVSYSKELMHGKQCRAFLDKDCSLFKDMPDTTLVARYHSLAAVEETIPECLKVIARADDGEIMAVKHKRYNVFGLQFHPESIMTPDGPIMMQNFLDLVKHV
ncbi:MAG: aminodeoxychorismate/anthranilate synthase component II [Synergistaceae bacterium]|nr:aminodeoxychorismate/anthranilate synthase component II [Synergistaceae bacterium]MEA4871905.1 aminodeoxychorismate/anthranilate synthase component II [Synergistaceae bacterium]